MPRKKREEAIEKSTDTKKEKKKTSVSGVIMGTGRRKTAVARVWFRQEKGPTLVNDKPIEKYFTGEQFRKIYEEPLRIVNRAGQFSGSIKVKGGGLTAQLGAVVHGMARALASHDPTFRQILSKRKLLTRDPRMKERRKYGHAGKARKMKQSPKR